jgi:hypothetical protein
MYIYICIYICIYIQYISIPILIGSVPMNMVDTLVADILKESCLQLGVDLHDGLWAIFHLTVKLEGHDSSVPNA